MVLTIAQRFRPFSHRPAVYALVPRTSLAIRSFPSCLEFYDWSAATPRKLGVLEFRGAGAFDEWTLLQDLEKGALTFWGKGSNGFFRCRLVAAAGALQFIVEKGSKIELLWEGRAMEGTQLPLAFNEAELPMVRERLFLGSTKKQEWERLSALDELLPLWYCLGVQSPLYPSGEGSSLYSECLEAPKELLAAKLLALIKTGFHPQGILLPQLQDENRWGYALPPMAAASPLALLSEGARLIRSMFISGGSAGAVSLLPRLPNCFHAGKLLGANLLPSVVFDLEWTKHKVRQLGVHASAPCRFHLEAPHGLKSCRLRMSKSDRGKKIDLAQPLAIDQPGSYILDQFQQ